MHHSLIFAGCGVLRNSVTSLVYLRHFVLATLVYKKACSLSDRAWKIDNMTQMVFSTFSTVISMMAWQVVGSLQARWHGK